MDLIKLSQFPSVAASAIATLVTSECFDKSIHALIFELGGGSFTKAMINSINVRLDGKDIVPIISGTNMQLLNSYDGLPNDAAYLAYFFGEPTAQTIRGQHVGDLDQSIYRKPLEIRVDIGAATTPALTVYAWVSVPKLDMGIGFENYEAAVFRSLNRTIIQPAGAVTRAAYNVNYGSTPGARIRQVNFLHTNLTNVDYRKNSITKHDNVSIALNSSLAKQYARVPQTGLYVLDRVLDGNQGEAETTVNPDGQVWNQQLAISTSAADTINVYADVHGVWSQI